MFRPRLVAVVLASLVMTAASDQTTFAARGIATRSVVYAPHGMVCARAAARGAGRASRSSRPAAAPWTPRSPSTPASDCMEPTANGLGGDLFAIVWDPKTTARCTASTAAAVRRSRSPRTR